MVISSKLSPGLDVALRHPQAEAGTPPCTVQSNRPLRNLTNLPRLAMTTGAGTMQWKSFLNIRREKIIVRPRKSSCTVLFFQSKVKCPVHSPQLLGVVLSVLSSSETCRGAEHHMSPEFVGHVLYRTNLRREPIAAGAFATRPDKGSSPFKWARTPKCSKPFVGGPLTLAKLNEKGLLRSNACRCEGF